MSTNLPESAEVIDHLINLSPTLSVSQLSQFLTDLSKNHVRAGQVLASLSVRIDNLVNNKVENATINIGFDHDPDIAESLLADWLYACVEDHDEVARLTVMALSEDVSTVQKFLTMVFAFYFQMLADFA